jgi:hypothetical protein
MLRFIPLLLVPVALYFGLIFMFGGDAAQAMDRVMVTLPLATDQTVSLTAEHLVLIAALFALFLEVLKATSTQQGTVLDHALSTLVFVGCVIVFMVVPLAGTPVFLLLTIMAMLDVIAGFTITIRSARRDVSFM